MILIIYNPEYELFLYLSHDQAMQCMDVNDDPAKCLASMPAGYSGYVSM